MNSTLSDHDLPPNNSTAGEELLNRYGDKDEGTSGRTGFGMLSWRPRYLQIFAKPFCFLIVLNIYCLVEGIIVSGNVIHTVAGLYV